MAQGDSPAVARRRVRLAVRDARQALNQTQTDVAEAMEWSLSKVQRIEKGDVTIAPNDLRPLLAYLGVRNRDRVEDLIQAAKVSRQRRQWWDSARFREHVTSPMLQLAGYEADAEEIYHFNPAIIPGVLQTPEYALTVLNSYGAESSRETRDVRVEFRQRRRGELLARVEPPRLLLILDESVLFRHMGDRAMHRAQLADLANLAQDGRLNVRIMPFEINESVPILGPFEIYYLGGNRSNPEENAVMYRESGDQDEMVEDVEKLRRHRTMFDRWWHSSYDEEKSAQLIGDHAK